MSAGFPCAIDFEKKGEYRLSSKTREDAETIAVEDLQQDGRVSGLRHIIGHIIVAPTIKRWEELPKNTIFRIGQTTYVNPGKAVLRLSDQKDTKLSVWACKSLVLELQMNSFPSSCESWYVKSLEIDGDKHHYSLLRPAEEVRFYYKQLRDQGYTKPANALILELEALRDD